jgi:ribosomal protein L40E
MGNTAGFVDFVSKRVLQKKGSIRAVCTKCGRKPFIARVAWGRKTRPLCPDCGTILIPSKSSQEKIPELCSEVPLADHKKRVCIVCNAKLASGNTGDKCRPCKSKEVPSITDMLRVMGAVRRAIDKGRR